MARASRISAWCLGLTLFLLAGTLTATKLMARRQPQPLAKPLATIPMEIAGWTGMAAPDPSEEVQGVLKASSILSRIYTHGGTSVELFIAFYAEQRAGESMHSPRVCLPANGWEISQPGSEPVVVAGERYKINRYIVQKGLERMTVLYWYQSRSEIVANEYLGKMLLIRNTILNGATAGSIVRLTFYDRPGAIPQAVDLAEHIIPEMRKCIGG